MRPSARRLQSGMKRRELETTLKAAGRVAHEVEFFLIGTQAVHAHCRRPPAEALLSQECDLYPKNRPTAGSIRRLTACMLATSFHYWGCGDSSCLAITPSQLRAARREPLVIRAAKPPSASCSPRRRSRRTSPP